MLKTFLLLKKVLEAKWSFRALKKAEVLIYDVYSARSILNIKHGEAMLIKTFIHQEFLKRGILWNGIISLSFSHNNLIINKILKSFREILILMKKTGINNLSKNLEGKVIKKLVL